jgi:hypothetical protein
VLVSGAITTAILAAAGAASIGVYLAEPELGNDAGGAGILIGLVATIVLMPLAYSIRDLGWLAWTGHLILYLVLVFLAFLAWIPLIWLPWRAVTRNRRRD